MLDRPLCVSGMGAVSCLGQDWPHTWVKLLEGQTARRRFEPRFPSMDLDVLVATVPDADRKIDNDLGCAARLGTQALQEATNGQLSDLAVYAASNHSESDIIVDLVCAEYAAAPSGKWRAILVDPIPSHISPAARPQSWVHSACTSGAHALLFALNDLAETASMNRAAVVASDALSTLGVLGFARAGASTRTLCRPFQANRDGMIVGEGAAAIMVSKMTCAKPGSVLVVGASMSCDAGHPTLPDPAGHQLERSILSAIQRAGLDLSKVGAVIAHGTGTRANDDAEANVFKRLWPEGIPVTSVKGNLGHTMGAAAIFNYLVAVESLRSGTLPPTVGNGEVVMGLDLVCGKPRALDRTKAIVATCSGFGGNNVSAVFLLDR